MSSPKFHALFYIAHLLATIFLYLPLLITIPCHIIYAKRADSALPLLVQKTIKGLDEPSQLIFEREYDRQKANFGTLLILTLLLPSSQFVAYGRWGLFVAFWAAAIFTAGVGFVVWHIIEIFNIARRRREYNENLAKDIVRDIKILA